MPAISAVRGTLLSTAATCNGFSASSCCCFRMYFWQSSSVWKRQGVAGSSGVPHALPPGSQPLSHLPGHVLQGFSSSSEPSTVHWL